ncbi:MAG: hypothetical protein AAB447_03940 [Patescibacteria group bacterium]
MLFQNLPPNCTFALNGSLCVKLPRQTSVAYGHRSADPLLCNAMFLHPEGADLLWVTDSEEIKADTLGNHPEVEKVLGLAPHTGIRRHLKLVTPILVENRERANAVLLGAPIAFISVL